MANQACIDASNAQQLKNDKDIADGFAKYGTTIADYETLSEDKINSLSLDELSYILQIVHWPTQTTLAFTALAATSKELAKEYGEEEQAYAAQLGVFSQDAIKFYAK